jgi:hypothetical protein
VSIGRNIIDRCGERPCLPSFYQVAKRMAEGHQPTLADKVRKALAQLRRRIAR